MSNLTTSSFIDGFLTAATQAAAQTSLGVSASTATDLTGILTGDGANVGNSTTTLSPTFAGATFQNDANNYATLSVDGTGDTSLATTGTSGDLILSPTGDIVVSGANLLFDNDEGYQWKVCLSRGFRIRV